MSLNMLHSIAFAKWLLNRNPASSPLEVLTLLEDSQAVWDLFIQSEDFLSLSRTSVDILIPQLVEKVPVNKRPTKKNVKPKPVTVPVFKTDAQTSTDSAPEESAANIVAETDAPVTEEGGEVVPPVPLKKEPKKRAPKKSKPEESAANIVADAPVVEGEVVTQEEVPVVPPVPLKKETKKRAPRKSKPEESAANMVVDAPVVEGEVVTQEEVPVVPPVPLKKETKKRAPKKSKTEKAEEPAANMVVDAPVTEEGGEVVTQEDEVPLKKETKKRAPKKSKVAEEEPAANIIANTEGEVVTQEDEVPLKKEPKKRAPKKSKTEKAEEPIIANTEGEDVPVVVPLKKETKKRAPKKSKPEEGGQPAANIVGAIPQRSMSVGHNEVKRFSERSGVETKYEFRTENADTDHDTDTELTEVVLPLLEQLHLGNSFSTANANDESRNFMILQEERSRIQPPHNNNDHDHELSHESYNHDNHDTELTEVFVNDVLFYTNHDQSLWFDSSLSPTNNPI